LQNLLTGSGSRLSGEIEAKKTSKRATGRCPGINRINLDNTKEF